MIILQVLFDIMLLLIIMSTIYQLKTKTKINIHNLPIILFFILLILCANYFAVKQTILYTYIGLFWGAIIWMLNAIKTDNLNNISITNKLILSIIFIICWPQVIGLIIFYILNYDQFGLNEKL